MGKTKERMLRNWLNGIKHEDTGAVSSRSMIHTCPHYKTGKEMVRFSGDLTIRDCSRQVVLDFDAFSKTDVKDRIKKVRILRKHLDSLEAGLQETYDKMT